MDASPIRVLQVDDDPSLLELTGEFLKSEDDRFTLETATSADEGLDQIGDRPPDCIVSDYDMPGENGIEFLQAVRETHPDLPFILFTGKGSESVASEAIAADVTDYLQKGPGSEKYELLANRIQNAVKARRKAQRADRQEQLIRLTEFAGSTGGFELDINTGKALLTDGARRILDISEQGAVNFEDELEALHEDDRDKIRPTIRRALQTGEQTRGTWRYRPSDGQAKLLNVTYTPATADGDEKLIRGAINDVTDRRERQQELRRLQQTIDGANVPITLADPSQPDEPLVYVNSAFEEMTGYPPDEAIGRNCRFLQGEETSPEKVTALREAIDNEEPITVEFRNYQKDDTKFWNQLTINPVYNDDGELIRYLGTQKDITKRKERQQELEQQRQRLTVALEGAKAGVWEWVPETDEVVWHESTEKLFGLEPGTFAGTYEAFTKRVPDEDLQILENAIEEALPSRDPFEADYHVYTDDGDKLWIHARAEFVDIEGLKPRYIGVISDISEQKERERTLEQTTKWYQTLLDTAPDAVFVADAESGVIRETNQAATQLLGRPREEIIGMCQENLHPPERADEYAEIFAEHVNSDDPDRRAGGQTDIHVLKSSGDRLPVEINARTVEINGETLNQGYFRDITDRKQRESELKRQNEQLQEFASVVSHDLRNPLMTAKGRLELAQADCDSAHLDDVAGALDRMDALIEDLLTLAQSGETVGNTEVVSLSSLIEKCWEVVPSENTTLTVETDQTISADQSRLQQLLENLFANAVEHGGEDVTVRVSDIENGFYVADDGVGIPDEEREDIFGAGYSTAEEGTGFGLRIVKQIVDAHGWDIRVTDSDDDGAQFEITGINTHT